MIEMQMKIYVAAISPLLVAALATPADAMDCQKASTKLERTICADPALLKAESAMTAAYLKLSRLAIDPDIHAALVNSQRRWVAARESDLASDDRDAGSASQRKILVTVTADRTKSLSAQVDGKPKFIVDALKQRASTAAYSGGPFAGYDSSCSFIPDRQDQTVYSYNCFGSHSVQNGDRVCTESEDFASYSSVEQRAVANVVNGKPKVIATCVLNSSNDSKCPDSDGGDKTAAWNMQPTPEQAQLGEGTRPRVKLDPEIADSDDSDWLARCLTDKSFPASSAVKR